MKKVFLAVGVLLLVALASHAGAEEKEKYNPEVPRISAFAVKKLFDEGKVLLVNAQEAAASARTLLLGAIAAPEGLIGGAELQIPEKLMVVFYCT